MTEQVTEREKQELLGIHADETQKVFENWSEETARKIARQLGIKLTDAHWDVINFLRVHYQNNGPVKHAHELAEELDERFSDQGGLRALYQLFPGGPISQGCRISGVPVPHDATDTSFGTVA
jgi:tRNA 2-thiouridine synthesizing protein E